MKFSDLAVLAALAAAPAVSYAQSVDVADVLRSVPGEDSPSLVLTRLGVEGRTAATRQDDSLTRRSELERPSWSRSQYTALLWAATLACAAMGPGCAAMPPAPARRSPPGSEPWRLAGCKSPDTCSRFWRPELPGPNVAAPD